LAIDEVSFFKLIKINEEEIRNNIFFAEQKFQIMIKEKTYDFFIHPEWMNKPRSNNSFLPSWVGVELTNIITKMDSE